MSGTADIMLRIGADGVILEASFGDAMGAEPAESWVGRSWEATVTEATRTKVRRLVSDAQTLGVSGFRQVNHTFPGGTEIPVEYSAVCVDDDGSLIAVGRSLLVVSELQQRLVSAQQAIERDHWRLREIETRYRLLFHRSPEAILVVEAETLRLVDANPVAEELLGLEAERTGRVERLADLVAEGDRARLKDHLRRVRETGRASPVRIKLVGDRRSYEARAALMSGDSDPLLLLHLTARSGAAPSAMAGVADPADLLERLPDAAVVVDERGDILWVNRRFLQLVQLRSGEEVRGENLSRWLGRPGADLTILRGMVARHGSVSLFSTHVLGEFGASAEVEISAVAVGEGDDRMALLLRDVGRRLGDARPQAAELSRAVEELSDEIGRTSLKALVARTVELVERQLISDALRLTDGNRTAAAELLGLSRQGLYTKLARYDLDPSTGA